MTHVNRSYSESSALGTICEFEKVYAVATGEYATTAITNKMASAEYLVSFMYFLKYGTDRPIKTPALSNIGTEKFSMNLTPFVTK